MRVSAVENIRPIHQRQMSNDTENQNSKKTISQNHENRADEKTSIDEGKILETIEKANDAKVFQRTKLKFSIHDETKEIMVKVIDEKTDEIIREIPPEKILDMVGHMWELAGILVDKKV